jgi:hypothetical protein
MPNYLLLSYAPDVGPAQQAERESELPLWLELGLQAELGGTARR